MKKVLSRVSIAVFIALALFLVSTFALPCLPAQAAATPECWAVLVGVSDYQSVYVNDLDYCDDDAQELYNALSPVWGASHIRLLKDSQATKANILSGISWMASNADASDTVFFSFSGHGRVGGWLCPYDTSPYNYNYDIHANQLADAFWWVNAGKTVIILDICHAGAFQYYVSHSGRVIIMACRADEESEERYALQNGVFTYAILRALAEFDAADANHDYELSAEEVAAYANLLTTQYISTQHPVIDDGYSGELALMAEFVFDMNTSLPAGTNILTIDGANYTSAPPPLLWALDSQHTITVPQFLDSGSGTHYFFHSWSDGGTSATIVISKGAYTAIYDKEYMLTVLSAFGEPQGTGWYDEGGTAHISVTPLIELPDTKHIFTGWSGGYTGTEPAASLVVNAPATVTANWRNEYLLSVNSDYGNPGGDGWYQEGDTAEFYVTPFVELTDTRHYFTGWSGDYSGTDSIASLPIDAPKTVDANWRHEYLLKVNSEYGSPTGAGWYKEGETAQFSVTPYIELPDTKHIFTGWSGSYTGTEAAASLSINAPKTVTADWRHEYLLKINSEYGSPTGAGWYKQGEQVPVAVEPVQGAIVRHIFTGWSGDLTATQSSTTVSMGSPKEITANWRTDLMQLYLLIGGVVVVVIIIAIIVSARRRSGVR